MKKVIVLSILLLFLLSIFVSASFSDWISGKAFLKKTIPSGEAQTKQTNSTSAEACQNYASMFVGDSITYGSKRITLESIGTESGAVVNVDGIAKSIQNLDMRNFPGVTVGVQDIIAVGTQGSGRSSVTLIIGKESCVASRLGSQTPPSPSQCFSVFGHYKIYPSQRDLYETVSSPSSLASNANVLVIEAVGQVATTGFLADNQDTSSLYIWVNQRNELSVFRQAQDSSKAVRVSDLRAPSDAGIYGTGPQLIGNLFLNFKATRFPIYLSWNKNLKEGFINVHSSFPAEGFDVYIKSDKNKLTYLGHRQGGSDIGRDIVYGNSLGIYTTRDISDLPFDIHSPHGLLIQQYKPHQGRGTASADEIRFAVPPDMQNYVPF